MKNIIITTPDNIEIEYRLAQVGSRMAAYVVDMAVQSILFLIIVVVFILAFIGNNVLDIIYYNFTGWVSGFLLLAFFMIYFGYFIIIEALTNGQSIGKRLFKLRVIRDNGLPIGFIQSFIRNIVRNTLDILGIGVVMIFFSKKCKRLGDVIASTIVVSENPSRIISENLALSNQLSVSEQNFAEEEYELSPDEYYLLKEFIIRRDTFIESSEIIKDNLVKYLANKYETSEDTFTVERLTGMLEFNKYRQHKAALNLQNDTGKL